ncbi:maleylacetoacetate isomerase [Sphingomonas sp. LaA6.9]|uniref:maleylacetoacetate isomerase n=1 Tax=Sphingomonas sp. LaA6.9 TaxID=2919914 RepID=UPI001F4FDD73|nr:maleylacetoacetate isomerase [Sphingomonas sp. LaA6.9]MCJ8158436.1 maleylacetoacetate isomerase [Sphingomonas sp. LaA6.9]
MTVRLFDYYRSSASYRVRIALNLKGIAYERVDISLLAGDQRSAENLARNPQGFVPTLEVDGAFIPQSLAIIDYLDARNPEPSLLPRDAVARAQALAQALVIAADTHPINNLRILQYLKNELGLDEAARTAWIHRWIGEGFAALEAMTTPGARFLGGDRPGLADICLVPQMYNARRFAMPLDAYPALVRIDAACAEVEAFAAAHPDRFAPAA